MTIQDLGSIGELIAAIATVATLVYLAVQLRQNTRALRSQTFQQISAQMGQNVENITANAELSEISLRAFSEPYSLSAAERNRVHGLLVMSFRRLEAVYVQCRLGSIDSEMMEGFERSLLPMLKSKIGSEWWPSARQTFHKSFVEHVEKRLSSADIAESMPSMPNQVSAADT